MPPITNANKDRFLALKTYCYDPSQIFATTSKPPVGLHACCLHQENIRLQVAMAQLSSELILLRMSHKLQGQLVQAQQDIIRALERPGAANGSIAKLPTYAELMERHGSLHPNPASAGRLPPFSEVTPNPLAVLAVLAEMHGSAKNQGERDGQVSRKSKQREYRSTTAAL